MSYDALIRLARVVDIDLMYNLDALDPSADLFQRGAATLAPPVVESGERIPVLANHDKTRPIGHVRELTHFSDVDGTWLMAHCTIDERPCWLERGSEASIGYSPMVTLPLGPLKRIMKAWVNEVSVLAPGRTGHNRGAKVWSLRRSAAAVVTSDRVAAAGTTRRRGRRKRIARWPSFAAGATLAAGRTPNGS